MCKKRQQNKTKRHKKRSFGSTQFCLAVSPRAPRRLPALFLFLFFFPLHLEVLRRFSSFALYPFVLTSCELRRGELPWRVRACALNVNASPLSCSHKLKRTPPPPSSPLCLTFTCTSRCSGVEAARVRRDKPMAQRDQRCIFRTHGGDSGFKLSTVKKKRAEVYIFFLFKLALLKLNISSDLYVAFTFQKDTSSFLNAPSSQSSRMWQEKLYLHLENDCGSLAPQQRG